MNTRRDNVLLWFGVLGGSVAWGIQFVANLAFGWAQCNPPVPRWQLPVHGWEIALSAGAIAIGIAAFSVSLRIFLRSRRGGIDQQELRGMGATPPIGRINFLSIVGLTVNFLSLSIIVMTGIGAPLLQVCRQS